MVRSANGRNEVNTSKDDLFKSNGILSKIKGKLTALFQGTGLPCPLSNIVVHNVAGEGKRAGEGG